MKKYLIAIVVLIVLGLLYWWITKEQTPVPASQTVTEQQPSGEVGGVSTESPWEETGKDGSAELPN